jgi:ER-bound oxygenase mpaB/B'/Rubber oxygenase, catalytic domain
VSELKGRLEAPGKGAENTDLVERSAAAYASAVPVTPEDDGFFGPASVTWRVAQRVRAIHEHVRGVDTVTGQPYAAGDPALLLWVHAALVDSGLAASALLGTPLTGTDADAWPWACSTRSSWASPACWRPGSGSPCGCVRRGRREPERTA